MPTYYTKRSPAQPIDYDRDFWASRLSQALTDAQYAEVVDAYRDKNAYLFNIIAEMTPGRMCDVGCGLGQLLANIDSRWEKHGVEIASKPAAIAARHATIHCGEFATAGYPDAYFDLITLISVLEHVEDPLPLIREALRVLKPGGRLLLRTPDFDGPAARRFGENFRLLQEATHISLFSTQSLSALLTDFGFDIDLVEHPWFDTVDFEKADLGSLSDISKPSPPFYGDHVLILATRPDLSRFAASVRELARLCPRLVEDLDPAVSQSGDIMAQCLLNGGKVLACGNGGSAADAQHFVAELVGRMGVERRAVPGISLSSDPSVVTALGNDYGYEQIFARQVEAFGQPGDVLLGISTSGHSPNVLKALALAREHGLQTVALVGRNGDTALENCDVTLHVNAPNTQRVQELHMAILHGFCDIIEQRLVQTPKQPQ